MEKREKNYDNGKVHILWVHVLCSSFFIRIPNSRNQIKTNKKSIRTKKLIVYNKKSMELHALEINKKNITKIIIEN